MAAQGAGLLINPTTKPRRPRGIRRDLPVEYLERDLRRARPVVRAIDTKTTAPLPEAYDAWRATQGLPPRSEVEREIAESDARIAFIQSHSVKEIADWIRAGSPV